MSLSHEKLPSELPPGPERRRMMIEQGFNTTPADYTAEELAQIREESAARRAAVEAHRPPRS